MNIYFLLDQNCCNRQAEDIYHQAKIGDIQNENPNNEFTGEVKKYSLYHKRLPEPESQGNPANLL